MIAACCFACLCSFESLFYVSYHIIIIIHSSSFSYHLFISSSTVHTVLYFNISLLTVSKRRRKTKEVDRLGRVARGRIDSRNGKVRVCTSFSGKLKLQFYNLTIIIICELT